MSISLKSNLHTRLEIGHDDLSFVKLIEHNKFLTFNFYIILRL